MRKNKRSKFVIYKKIQYKYAVLTIALLVLYTVLLLTAIFAPSIAIFMSEDISIVARAEAANAFLLLNRYMWPGIAAIILLFGVFSLFVTHKIAGPLFVMERMINQIASGQLSARIRLRKGDDLTEFEQLMNGMAENLESSLSDLHERSGSLSALAHELAQGPDPEKQAKLLSETGAIARILEQYAFSKKRKEAD
jgi:methyl-accepting chemotaxis protein